MTTTTMHRAAVDAEFRALVLESPEFVATAPGALPAPIEKLDMSALEEWTTDTIGRDLYACGSTCSFGPFTFYCDGTSK